MMNLQRMVRGMMNDTVAKQFIQRWEHDSQTLKFWRASSNFVFTFERDGVRQFLRFIHEEDNAISHIQSELDFMLYLIENGYPTVAPIRSADGNWIETVQVDEDGRYYGVVFEQARGSCVPLDQMTDRQAEAWGAALGSLHRLSELYAPGPTSRGSWLDALTFVSSVLDRHPREADARHELERLREQLSALPTGAGHIGLIHYDFEMDNVFFEAETSRYFAIDFDDSMYHWYAMDVASAISDLLEQEDADANEKIAHFLTGYRKMKPLDEYEVRQFALFQRFEDLYRFARMLSSVEGFESGGSPAWALALKEKLLGVCDRIREGYRPQVSLRPVDQNNWYACTQLEVTDEQKKVFPVPAVYWLAESAYCGFNPLALYVGDQLAGLAICAVDPDDESCWIVAYMIDRHMQQRGVGRSGMEALIRYC